eukprot:gene9970-6960_t
MVAARLGPGIRQGPPSLWIQLFYYTCFLFRVILIKGGLAQWFNPCSPHFSPDPIWQVRSKKLLLPTMGAPKNKIFVIHALVLFLYLLNGCRFDAHREDYMRDDRSVIYATRAEFPQTEL